MGFVHVVVIVPVNLELAICVSEVNGHPRQVEVWSRWRNDGNIYRVGNWRRSDV